MPISNDLAAKASAAMMYAGEGAKLAGAGVGEILTLPADILTLDGKEVLKDVSDGPGNIIIGAGSAAAFLAGGILAGIGAGVAKLFGQ